MSFADWLWSVITPALGLKTIPDLLDTNSTYTGITYAHITASHSCDYMGYVRRVGKLQEAAIKTIGRRSAGVLVGFAVVECDG